MDTVKNNDIICLTGFTLAGTGKLKSSQNRLTGTIIKLSKKYKTRIYPLVNLSCVKQGMDILDSVNKKNRAVREISLLLKKYSFKGIHLDFEYLPAEYSLRYADFLKQLRKKIHPAEITIAVFPHIEFPFKWSGFHNPDILKNHVDNFVIMCYDQHRKDTKAGPVADLAWAEKNIHFYLKKIDPSKLIMGIPAYGYIWSSDGRCRTVSARYGKTLAARYGFTRHSSGNMYIVYTVKGINHRAFISDKAMRIKLKQKSIDMNLKGWAVWRKGLEDR